MGKRLKKANNGLGDRQEGGKRTIPFLLNTTGPWGFVKGPKKGKSAAWVHEGGERRYQKKWG